MPDPETPAVLSLRGLRKAYGDLVAVRDLSLDVVQGEVFGFLGPNGAGKTTTIRMICGLLGSDSGQILVNGDSISEHPRLVRKMLGLCPQEIVVWESLSCLEQLVFVGTQYDLPRSVARARAGELLEALGLSEKSRKLARTLSGGMKRRMNLALALVHDPEILVLDEPQAGLDPQSRILVREYIRSLARRKTVLLTTHEMDEADRLSDRVGIIDRGQMLVVDTPVRLKASLGGSEIVEIRPSGGDSVGPEDTTAGVLRDLLDAPDGARIEVDRVRDTVRFSGDGIQDLIPGIRQRLDAAGLEVQDLRVRKPTLEDVFISLTGRDLRE